MAKKVNKRKQTQDKFDVNIGIKIGMSITIMLLSLLTIFKAGIIGESISTFMFKFIGSGSLTALISMIIVSCMVLADTSRQTVKVPAVWGILLVNINLTIVLALIQFDRNTSTSFIYNIAAFKTIDGGIFGNFLFGILQPLMGILGVILISILLTIASLYCFFGMKVSEVVKTSAAQTKQKLDTRATEYKLNKELRLLEEEQRQLAAEAKRLEEEEQLAAENKPEIVTEFVQEEIKEPTTNRNFNLFDAQISENTLVGNQFEPKIQTELENDNQFEVSPLSEEIKITRDEDKISNIVSAIPTVDTYVQPDAQAVAQEMMTDFDSTIPPAPARKTPTPPLASSETDQNHRFEDNIHVMTIEETETKQVVKSKDSKYVLPSIELLNDTYNDNNIFEKLKANANTNAEILEATLKSFNLKAKILNIAIGPNITKFEIQPEIGTKVSKFSSLSNDLAMALAAESIRIEAPIPGKAAVGIEIPNEQVMSVSLKEVLKSKNNDMSQKLQVGLGKDIAGQSLFLEINKTPHMLVAGSTGSGKSVSINSMIISILLKATPDEVKMIMIDPKKVELTPYNGIAHLITPVVTEPKKAAVVLNKMVAEMEQRYEMFAHTNTRNIEGFNEKLKTDNPNNYPKLPYIVIIIDELADLMMVAASEVETSIARLAQMARAAGIHLIIATQRPSTDVITGLIKSNIPTRLSFSVSSSIDSRTILDQSGAEKLLGKGDMLYSPNGKNSLFRIQGTFLSDAEISKVVDFIREQTNTDPEILQKQEEFDQSIQIIESSDENDEYYDEALQIVLEENRASTALLQRRLRVGFNRATRLMDQLEANGVISAAEGTKPRTVLQLNGDK